MFSLLGVFIESIDFCVVMHWTGHPGDVRCISKSYLGAWISIDMSALVDTLPKSFVDIELLASILFFNIHNWCLNICCFLSHCAGGLVSFAYISSGFIMCRYGNVGLLVAVFSDLSLPLSSFDPRYSSF